MATTPVKYKAVKHREDNTPGTLDIMKPFLRFGFKAMVLIGTAAVGIIKLLPALLREGKQPTRR